ncbi:MAG: asparagine synthase-related protein [Bacteroidota bacterium]|nr:asparagine synthase-related protein [Bacteroidota bacterium]
MSAIYGIVHLSESPVEKDDLERMQKGMAYWGPNGAYTWQEGQASLGQLMMCATPESLLEKYPLFDESGNLVLMAAARIDNRQELFEQFSISTSDRRQVTDSLLILKAYQKWGKDCVLHLVGDWAFAIWDRLQKKLFLARDHHGNTGMFYYYAPGFFVFSSALKGILSLPRVPKEPNPFRIAQILVSWQEQDNQTSYQNIFHLPPAHFLEISEHSKPKLTQYWDINNIQLLNFRNDSDYVDAFLEIYREAVHCRLRTIRKAGLTLSGGLDSGSVTALASEDYKKYGIDCKIPAFTSVPLVETSQWISPRLFGDEQKLAKATAGFCGNIDLQFIKAEQTSPLEGIEKMIELRDEPSHAAGNHFWIVALMAEAQKQGIDVLLTGQGGNGTVSWPTGNNLSTGKLSDARLDDFRHLKTIKSKILKPMVPVPVLEFYHLLKHGHNPWLAYSAISTAFAQDIQLGKLMKEMKHDPNFAINPFTREAHRQIINPGCSQLGTIWQSNSAGFSIEVRDPTLDRRLIEFCFAVPDDQYVRNGKGRMLLRRAMKGYMPEEVLWNERRGRQAADIGYRVQQNYRELSAVLEQFEKSELVSYYLNVPKMKTILESVKSRVTKENTGFCVTTLLRGIGTGLFLQRF